MKPVSLLNDSATTTEIIELNAARPLHLRMDDGLDQCQVSTTSRWGDRFWQLDYQTPGADKSVGKIFWDFELQDGRKLTDPVHRDILDWAKRLVWSLLAAPAEGAATLSPGTIGLLSPGLRYLLRWLVRNGIVWPRDIRPQDVRTYLRDIESDCEDAEDGKVEFTQARVYNKLRPLHVLWQQRFVLARIGIEPMPSPPFGRGSAGQLAQKISKIAYGSYRPLPDEIAIPVLNKSMQMLGTPAEDVISLAHGCVEAYANGSSMRPKLRAQKEFAFSFEFHEENETQWHWPMNPMDWDAEHVQHVESRLRNFVKLNSARVQSSKAASKTPDLPFVSKIRNYVDTKKIFFGLGLRKELASALPYLPSWRSVVQGEVSGQGLFLPSGNPIHRVRKLILDIQAAAHLVIQATTGMRISEIAGMQAGIDETTGLPMSVELRDSTSGIGEVFILRSKLAKTEETPRTVEWTLGYRIKGSSEVPPAIRAIQVVDRLMSPWRLMLGTNDLFLTFANPVALPLTGKNVSRPKSYRLRETAREFIEEWVDLTELPDNAARPTIDDELVPYRVSHGRIIKTHQFRKLFANFAYRVDAKMLPVLQMHFHHISIAMTDGGYIMSDPALLREQDDVRHQQSALMALETATGVATLAGRYAVELEEKLQSELAPRVKGLDAEAAYDEAFIYVEESGIDRLFYEPYGICGAKSASEMACHREGGTEDLARWSHRLVPNYETRRPSLCAGCPSFVVASWHRSYWEKRYFEHAVPLALLRTGRKSNQGEDPYFLVTQFRMRQAMALARKLGSDMTELDRQINVRVKEIHDASPSPSDT